jgi:hypothetical protein
MSDGGEVPVEDGDLGQSGSDGDRYVVVFLDYKHRVIDSADDIQWIIQRRVAWFGMAPASIVTAMC